MKSIFGRFLLLIGIVISGQLLVTAQDPVERTGARGMVLEISTRERFPPANIALRSDRWSGFWTSNVERIKNWVLPSESLPIQVVNFQAQRKGNVAELRVSVYSGKRFKENDELVATYTLSEGESATITELSKYGIAPIGIRMVSVAPSMANIPVVFNSTQAISVTLSPMVATLPSFRTVFKNISEKNVTALFWHTQSGERMLLSAMPHGQYGKPLMASDGSYELVLRAPNPDTVSGAFNLYIDGVMFSDGSFEGDGQTAANYRAFEVGRKDTLIKILAELKPSVRSSGKPDIEALINKIDSDQRPVDAEILRSFHLAFQMDRNAKNPTDPRIKAAADRVRTEVLEALRRLQNAAGEKSDNDINQALADVVSHLEEWLERIPG